MLWVLFSTQTVLHVGISSHALETKSSLKASCSAESGSPLFRTGMNSTGTWTFGVGGVEVAVEGPGEDLPRVGGAQPAAPGAVGTLLEVPEHDGHALGRHVGASRPQAFQQIVLSDALEV